MTVKKNASRDSFKSFMEKRGLKPHPWAKKAGVRSSTLYNYLSGVSANLTADTLQKLAKAASTSVDELLDNTPVASKATPPQMVRVEAVVGIYGRVFSVDDQAFVARPIGLPTDVEVLAARIDKDGLHPIPGGWTLFYEKQARPPDALIGKLAVVDVTAQKQRLVREIQRVSQAGLYTLTAWNAAALIDVEVDAAHAVVSIAQVV